MVQLQVDQIHDERNIFMYTIDFKEHFKLLNWDVIYWGIEKDFIEAQSAIDYANKLIEYDSAKDDAIIVELFLLDYVNKDEVLSRMCKLYPQSALKEKNGIRCLRYMILDDIMRKGETQAKILRDVEDVYADFDYPSDMTPFISYMPIENEDYNPSAHTQEENEKRLFEKFTVFLERERQHILSNPIYSVS